jgi:tyrosyl-tRNA synthetase
MDDLLTRGVDTIIGRAELEAALATGKRKLRIKFGVDPTRPDLHIGHAVVMNKLRQFQDLGHTVIFLIGDYTTKIGDPSGKNQTRPMLSDEEIAANVKTYLDQVGQLLDIKKAEVRYNSEWLAKLSFGDIINLASNISVAQIIERDDFKSRLSTGAEIASMRSCTPLCRPTIRSRSRPMWSLAAAISYSTSAGRCPPKRNSASARRLFSPLGLLVGLDGVKKMSKSLDNYVGVTDAPLDMYGKIMSVPDPLIAPYYKLCTQIPLETIDALVQTLASGANPRDSKASLAREIVRIYHGETAALKAEEAWNAQFRDGGRPADIAEYEVDPTSPAAASMLDLLIETGMAASKNEARTLISQGGVRLNDNVVQPGEEPELKDGQILQVGKRRYLKLRHK